MRSFVISALRQIILIWSYKGGWDEWGMLHWLGRWEIRIQCYNIWATVSFSRGIIFHVVRRLL